LNGNETIARLHKLNATSPHTLDVFNNGELVECSKLNVYDHLKTKWWAIKFATDAAVTILRVD
jgi:T-complex protein 1 subunit theta